MKSHQISIADVEKSLHEQVRCLVASSSGAMDHKALYLCLSGVGGPVHYELEVSHKTTLSTPDLVEAVQAYNEASK